MYILEIYKKLLDEYRRDQKYHYMDIGRVGRHLSNGKYYIEKPIIAELITIPKIIITQTPILTHLI